MELIANALIVLNSFSGRCLIFGFIVISGGLPDNQTLQRQTKNVFKKPFVGCLENINIGTEDLNDFSSYDGENIGSCDYDDFSYLK